MSNAIKPLHAVKVLDPRVDLSNVRRYAVEESGAQATWKPILSTSFSNSSIQFSAPPPSPQIIVDRKVYLRVPVTLTFAGVGAVGTGLLQSGFDAFRAFPLSSVISTMTATLNNTTVSINLADQIQALLRYNNDVKLRNHEWSLTPSALDQSQVYADLVNTVRNPLAAYGDSSEGAMIGRGAFPYDSFTNLQNSAVVTATLTEPLFLPPMCFGQGNESGFYGLQTFDMNITFNSDLSRMWSHSDASGNTISSITVTIGQPALLFSYITPKEVMRIPQEGIVYPYYDLQRYPTDAGAAIASNASTTLSSANIQLNSIPRRLYIFARQRNADQTFTSTDSFFQINNVSIQWENRQGILSSASPQDLYNISKKNGCNLSYDQWRGVTQTSIGGVLTRFGAVGSVLAVDPADDFGLDSLQAPGILGTYQLQINCNVTNINQSSAITPTLYIVVVNEGSFTILDNRAVSQIGVITRQDVLDAEESHETLGDLRSMEGGNFFSGLKRFGKKAAEVYKKVKPAIPVVERAIETFVPQAAPFVQKEREVRKALGLGVVGGVGGKKLSRKQLKEMMYE